VSWIESFAGQLTGGGVTGAAALGVAFLGGIVAGFGPCVLPMLPAVFGYVTGHVADAELPRGSAWRRGLALSGTFVLGMALLFAGIGAAAGAVGHAIMVGAWAYYAVAAICVVLGLQMVGLVNIRFDALNRFLPTTRPKGRGFAGAFLLGILFGVVASPCSTPILAAIATIAAARGSATQGAVMLFVYGLGKGVPLMLLGLVSGSLALVKSLSRATGVLTKIGGVALLGAAAYLVWLA
jgi:cytochrome c-type biogenesis protein